MRWARIFAVASAAMAIVLLANDFWNITDSLPLLLLGGAILGVLCNSVVDAIQSSWWSYVSENDDAY